MWPSKCLYYEGIFFWPIMWSEILQKCHKCQRYKSLLSSPYILTHIFLSISRGLCGFSRQVLLSLSHSGSIIVYDHLQVFHKHSFLQIRWKIRTNVKPLLLIFITQIKWHHMLFLHLGVLFFFSKWWLYLIIVQISNWQNCLSEWIKSPNFLQCYNNNFGNVPMSCVMIYINSSFSYIRS